MFESEVDRLEWLIDTLLIKNKRNEILNLAKPRQYRSYVSYNFLLNVLYHTHQQY